MASSAPDETAERHDVLLTALRRAVLDSPGSTDPAVRANVASGHNVPESMESYVAKVRDHSYRITDGDLASLKAAGLTEDQIFELTVAAALGAALDRLDAGTRAIHGQG